METLLTAARCDAEWARDGLLLSRWAEGHLRDIHLENAIKHLEDALAAARQALNTRQDIDATRADYAPGLSKEKVS